MRSGPLGDIFSVFGQPPHAQNVAIVGLGVGTMKAYQQPGQEFTFFEIDPRVAQIAENPEFFTFLSDCGAGNHRIVLGDGRIELSKLPDGEIDLLVFDAFSSDAVPVHLLTREAVQLYLEKTSDDGVIAFQITNVFLDLVPVVATLAADAGLQCWVRDDSPVSRAESRTGKQSSTYAIMIPPDADTASLRQRSGWVEVSALANGRPWTDDFSNILSAVRGW